MNRKCEPKQEIPWFSQSMNWERNDCSLPARPTSAARPPRHTCRARVPFLSGACDPTHSCAQKGCARIVQPSTVAGTLCQV